jgi:hypothetical protein
LLQHRARFRDSTTVAVIDGTTRHTTTVATGKCTTTVRVGASPAVVVKPGHEQDRRGEQRQHHREGCAALIVMFGLNRMQLTPS